MSKQTLRPQCLYCNEAPYAFWEHEDFHTGDFVDITCPHCKKEYSITRTVLYHAKKKIQKEDRES